MLPFQGRRAACSWAAFVALVVALAACGGSGVSVSAPASAAPSSSPGASGEGAGAVTMQGLAFLPRSVTVAVGSTVTWTNKDSVGHTVTADGGTFASGTVPGGGSFSQTFATAGSFPYHCAIHPSMTGTVVVR